MYKKPITYVYIDAFNLYYGAVKGTSYKWLDLAALCRFMLPDHDIRKIKYFTARVKSRSRDPHKPLRQQIYLRALGTIPNLSIIYGHFLSHAVKMPRADSAPGKPEMVRVVKTEEKGSDVNLAAHLLSDGYENAYDIAVVVSNDSDLLEPVKIVNTHLGKPVGVLNPHKHPSRELLKHAKFFKKIRCGVLKQSQFPDRLTDANGSFHKPKGW